MTQTLLLRLSIIFLLITTFFVTTRSTPTTPPKQIARLNIFSEPLSLDPRIASDITSGTVIRTLFEGLTRIDTEGKPRLAAAETVEISKDQRFYRFQLRQNFWSNGDPVTAEDFVLTWKTILTPRFPSTSAFHLYVLKNGEAAKNGTAPINSIGVWAEDPKTLVVELEYPCPYFLELLSSYTFYPVHQQSELNTDFVSNGPFELSSWRHDDLIEVTKNPHYWDKENVLLDGLTMAMVDKEVTELAMFESGELDWVGAPMSILPIDSLGPLKEKGLIEGRPVAGVYLYRFNTKLLPFTNKKMRLAFSKAVDRQTITDHIHLGGQRPADRLVPPEAGGNESFLAQLDTNEARRLFQEAMKELDLTLETFPPITLSYNTGEDHHRIAQTIQQQWNRAFGIQVLLENAEWKVHLSKMVQNDFQIGRKGWFGDYTDPMAMLEPFRRRNGESGGSNNNTQWQHPKFVRLLDQAEETSDQELRSSLLHEAEEIWLDEAPAIPIFFVNHHYLKNPKLHGVVHSSIGQIDFRWAYFD